jgi:hypothetical protein
MRPMTMLLPAGLVAVALAAGCGDNDDENTLSKREFVAHAGAICERNKARAGRVFKREFADLGDRQPTAAESQRLLATMLPIIRDSGEGIARLEPPEGDEERIETYLTAYERAAVEMERIAKDPKRTRALMTGKLEDPFVKPDGMAGEYGIKKCSGDKA